MPNIHITNSQKVPGELPAEVQYFENGKISNRTFSPYGFCRQPSGDLTPRI